MTFTFTVSRKKLAVLLVLVVALAASLVMRNGGSGSAAQRPTHGPTTLLEGIRLAAATADGIFVSVAGFPPGESTLEKHAFIGDVISVDSNVTAVVPAKTGGANPKAPPVQLSRPIDNYTTQFLGAMTSGERLATVKIYFTVIRSEVYDPLVMTLWGVHVVKDAISVDKFGDAGEHVSLAFTQMRVDYRGQKDDGSLKPPVTFCWNFAADKSC